ncbi:MAG TPA: hypothetical protein VHN14_23260 [Kofleriaceae bacterium]|jgi:hypothetical protein|nr:hypothetical protein [Kofleriaceae bacterium]
MVRAPSTKQVVAIPTIGEVWAGHEVRRGTADDADTLAQWRSDDGAVNGALKVAVDALRHGSPDPIVYIVDEAQDSIGVVTIGWNAPCLQFVFVDEPDRRGDVGTKATSVAIEEVLSESTG